MYFPWHPEGMARQVPYQFTAGYAVLALLLLLFSFTKESAHAPQPAARLGT